MHTAQAKLNSIRLLISTSSALTLLLICLWFPLVFIGQPQFTVFQYESSEYKIGNQNWDMCTDELGRVFIANNAGLLVLDGSGVALYEMPGQTILRSVACIGKRVYSGSFEEFGYWEEISYGEWIYVSLVPLMDRELFQNDEIWKIVSSGDAVYFQSFGNIFVFENGSVRAIELPGSVLFLLKSGDRLFAQQVNGGLYELVDDHMQLFDGSEIFANTEIKAILPLSDSSILIGTGTMGLFTYDGWQFKPWATETKDVFNSEQAQQWRIA
jgi:hypothetical protein